MTAKVGYGGGGENEDSTKARRSERDRARYLRRMANPDEYASYLAKARADQAVRDAAKRAGKT